MKKERTSLSSIGHGHKDHSQERVGRLPPLPPRGTRWEIEFLGDIAISKYDPRRIRVNTEIAAEFVRYNQPHNWDTHELHTKIGGAFWRRLKEILRRRSGSDRFNTIECLNARGSHLDQFHKTDFVIIWGERSYVSCNLTVNPIKKSNHDRGRIPYRAGMKTTLPNVMILKSAITKFTALGELVPDYRGINRECNYIARRIIADSTYDYSPEFKWEEWGIPTKEVIRRSEARRRRHNQLGRK